MEDATKAWAEQVRSQGHVDVIAHPNAKRAQLRIDEVGAAHIYVTVVPEKGRANAAIRKALAKALGIGPSRLHLVRGETAKIKRFVIEG